MTEAQEIAARLSEQERKALCLLDGQWWAGPQMPDILLDGALTKFRADDLVEREFADEGPPRYSIGSTALSVRLSACWHFRLTPLGEQVKHILTEKPE